MIPEREMPKQLKTKSAGESCFKGVATEDSTRTPDKHSRKQQRPREPKSCREHPGRSPFKLGLGTVSGDGIDAI